MLAGFPGEQGAVERAGAVALRGCWESPVGTAVLPLTVEVSPTLHPGRNATGQRVHRKQRVCLVTPEWCVDCTCERPGSNNVLVNMLRRGANWVHGTQEGIPCDRSATRTL